MELKFVEVCTSSLQNGELLIEPYGIEMSIRQHIYKPPTTFN